MGSIEVMVLGTWLDHPLFFLYMSWSSIFSTLRESTFREKRASWEGEGGPEGRKGRVRKTWWHAHAQRRLEQRQLAEMRRVNMGCIRHGRLPFPGKSVDCIHRHLSAPVFESVVIAIWNSLSLGRTFKDENSDLVPISHFSGPNSIPFHIQLPNSWFPISHFFFLTPHFSFLTWCKNLKYESLNYSRVLYFQFGY